MPRIAISRPAGALFAALLIVLLTAAAASAGSTKKILEACGEGRIPSGYSQQAYNQALKQLPPELAEYSDCADLIHKAQRTAASGGPGGGASGSAAGSSAAVVAPPTSVEQHALDHIPHTGGAPVKVGAEVVNPGVVHVDITSALVHLPTPLLTLLAFLLACALLFVGRTVLARVHAHRHDS